LGNEGDISAILRELKEIKEILISINAGVWR